MNDSLGKYGPCFNAGIKCYSNKKEPKDLQRHGCVLGVKPPFSLS